MPPAAARPAHTCSLRVSQRVHSLRPFNRTCKELPPPAPRCYEAVSHSLPRPCLQMLGGRRESCLQKLSAAATEIQSSLANIDHEPLRVLMEWLEVQGKLLSKRFNHNLCWSSATKRKCKSKFPQLKKPAAVQVYQALGGRQINCPFLRQMQDSVGSSPSRLGELLRTSSRLPWTISGQEAGL